MRPQGPRRVCIDSEGRPVSGYDLGMFGFGKKRPEDGDTLQQPLPAGWSVVERGLLGAGGMSRVYKLEDTSLGREVALKVLRPELSGAKDAVARFVDEARITAQLDHPNIPPVYALAAEKRVTCFTMKVLGGLSLQQLLEENEREGVDGLFAALDVLQRVCDAMAFAHARGVLHLDLKPANVMVGDYGQIYVVDWGLARKKSELPKPGQDDRGTNGTPSYMAPEQAAGENWRLDERTDVFALGGMLYRVLTGVPPYREATADATMLAAAKGVVVPPERRVPAGQAVNRRLSLIAMKALAKDPAERHQTVDAFKQELEDFVRGLSHLPRRSFKAGEVIFREGDEGDAAYVIFEGQCEASRQIEGRTVPLRRLETGTMFGEAAVFANARRSATVTALTDGVLGVVDQLFLREEMERTSFMSLAIRTLAAGFLDLDSKAAAGRARQVHDAALAQVLKTLALSGEADGPTRRLPAAPLLDAIAGAHQLDVDTLRARVLSEPGLRLDGPWLVLHSA